MKLTSKSKTLADRWRDYGPSVIATGAEAIALLLELDPDGGEFSIVDGENGNAEIVITFSDGSVWHSMEMLH